jgi:hypothetical protein
MRKIVLSTVTALALLAGPAGAADLGVFGSYWDTRDADQGFGGGAKLDFARFIELRASYFRDVTSNDPLPRQGDFKIRVTPLEAGLVFKFAQHESFTPYVGGGAGYYLLDTNRGDIDNETGWYGVAGADIKTDRGFGIMLEAIYRDMNTTVRGRGSDITIDDQVDLQLRGIGANVGLVWSF